MDWIQNWSARKKETIVGSLSVIGGMAILIGYFLSGPKAFNYAHAEMAFSEWSAKPEDEKLYHSMREAIRNVPDLQQKYEAIIAQKLLNTDKLEEALVLANHSLKRVEDEIPLHADYAKSSLLIEQGRFQQALERAVALKERMGDAFLSEGKAGSLLYLHNLVRIACLQQQLKNRPGERAAWEELETFLQTKTVFTQNLLDSFSDKQLSLIQYIAERKKFL